MATKEATEFLARCPLFAQLKPKELRALAESGRQRSFSEGETIIEEGDSGLGFYLILEGEVEVRRGGQTLSRLGTGNFFGEMALLDGQPRSADVVAVATTTCLVITSWDLHGLFGGHPSVAVGMLRQLAKRLRETDTRLTE